MPARSSFDYAIVRVVPRVERGEFINAGVILFCRTQRFLEARIELDTARLLALAPAVDLTEVRDHLAVIPRVASTIPVSPRHDIVVDIGMAYVSGPAAAQRVRYDNVAVLVE